MSGAVTPDRLMAAGIPVEAANLLGTSMAIANVSANVSFGPFPPRSYISKLLLREKGGTSVNVGMGTTLNATDVLATAQGPLTANGTFTVDVTAFSKGSFPALTAQLLFLTFSGSPGYLVDASLLWDNGP